jgi:arylsulfatase A-like enzyme
MHPRRYSRRGFLEAAGLAAAAASAPHLLRPASAAGRAGKPNILLILVDDLGKDWIGCCGADGIRTPHIDALAAGGMRFTHAYSMPQCTPTRVTLLTGQYPWRTGWVNHWDVPRWGVGYFDWKHSTTFARILKAAGYATAAAGKWQVNDFRLAPDAMKRHGFDEWCMWTGFETGNAPSGNRYADPYINTPQGSRTHKGKFGPDVYTDFLIDFMKRHRDGPMLLYFPMALTHGPLVATPDEPNATGRLERHKAMVRYVDKLVGRLVKALDELGIRRETIVLFTTDNGSAVGGSRNGRKVAPGKAKKTEAGVCAPFIANGPGRIPAGVVSDALTDFTDLLPTFIELAGAAVPKDLELDGVSIAPVLLGKAKDSPRQWILALGHGAGRADEKGVRGQHDYADRVLRDKRYKVWVETDRRISQLYDLQADPWEEKNLIASKEAARAAALRKFQAVVDSLPERDARPRYDPRAANPWDRKPAPGKAKKDRKAGKEKRRQR